MSKRLTRPMRTAKNRIQDKHKECQAASSSARAEKRISMKEAVRLEWPGLRWRKKLLCKGSWLKIEQLCSNNSNNVDQEERKCSQTRKIIKMMIVSTMTKKISNNNSILHSRDNSRPKSRPVSKQILKIRKQEPNLEVELAKRSKRRQSLSLWPKMK